MKSLTKDEIEKHRLMIEALKLKLWTAGFKDSEVIAYIEGCTDTMDWCKKESWNTPLGRIEFKMEKVLGEREFKRIMGIK